MRRALRSRMSSLCSAGSCRSVPPTDRFSLSVVCFGLSVCLSVFLSVSLPVSVLEYLTIALACMSVRVSVCESHNTRNSQSLWSNQWSVSSPDLCEQYYLEQVAAYALSLPCARY